MALNFPASPSTGDIHNASNNLSYFFDGVKWITQGSYNTGTINAVKLDSLTSSFNGSLTTFNLTANNVSVKPANAESVQISLGGVIQEPSTAYTINSSEGKITFTSAPATNTAFFGILYSRLPIQVSVTNISNADISDTAAIAQSKLNIANATTSASGFMSGSDKTKLNAIENGATADQTNAEIRAAVEAASDSNVFTDADHNKLNAIEASADVTDATNVDAAGAVMNSDLDGKGELLVGDGSGDPSALSVGTNGYVLKANSSTATGLEWAAETGGGGGGISNLVEDTTPQLGGNLDVQSSEITTSTSNGNIKLNPNGTGVVEVKGDGSSADGTIQLNCSQNSHGVKLKSPPHSANASYTLTLPNTDGNANQVLKTDGSGGLDWVDQTTDTNTTYSAGSGLSLSGTTFSVDTLNQNTTGSAATLTTPRAINGVNFDGSADITIADSTKLPTAGGTLTGNVSVADDVKIQFGAGNDLQIYHNNTDNWSYIEETDVAVEGLRIRGQNLVLEDNAGDNYILCKHDAEVILYYDNSAKIETTSTGVEITGKIDISGAIDENVFAITDASSVALDPDNGMIQTWTLGANRTATDSLTTGQSMILIVTASGSNYTVTWPTMTWVGGSAPTLGGATPTAIELFKVGSTLYGATVGNLG